MRASLQQLPKGLNETYANILRRTSPEDSELLRRILVWVTCTVLPLTLENLREAIAVEYDVTEIEEIEESRLHNPRDILIVASSLLIVSEDGHVKLAHLSVKDYLLSAEIRGTPSIAVFSISLGEVYRELALDCLAYLSLKSLSTGPSTTTEDWESRLTSHPLLRHAAKGWTYYTRQAQPSTELKEATTRFFSSESSAIFMSWIQILNSNWIFEWKDYPRHATPLYYAASFGLEEVVASLIEKNVDVNAPGSRFGGTALHGAALREHVPIMEALLKAGADPSRADFNNVTPLHTATRVGNAEVIKLLLKYGASKTAPDKLGETPVDWAKKVGNDISQKLLSGESIGIDESEKRFGNWDVYRRTVAFFPAMAVAQGISAAGGSFLTGKT